MFDCRSRKLFHQPAGEDRPIVDVHPNQEARDKPALPRTPTSQAYGELQVALDFFNVRLLNGELPPCIITMTRRRGTYGYFAPDWWEDSSGTKRCDEISMNPSRFPGPIREVLATLMHEGCHLWQQHYGSPGRHGYHNVEWASKMQSIGLIPSHTGKPGGRKTGYRMLDYIEPGGPFDRACQELLAKGFEITWRSVVEHWVSTDTDSELGLPPTGHKPSSTSGKRTKFTCPECGLNAWAKRSAHLVCGECSLRMPAASEKPQTDPKQVPQLTRKRASGVGRHRNVF